MPDRLTTHPATSSSAIGVLGAIGQTPLIRLSRLDRKTPAQIYAKLEYLNPGGSMKDRPALAMLKGAIDSGELKPGGIVIESSSGNTGVGLAQACTYLGLRFICVVDTKTTVINRRLLAAYGAEVVIVEEPHPVTRELLDARLERVAQLQRKYSAGFSPNQYTNACNRESHFRGTAPELFGGLGTPPDVMLVQTSTCGTLAGFQKYISEQGLPTRLIAVDAQGSRLFGGAPGPRHIPGLGASKESRQLVDAEVEVMRVDDTDCVIGCQMLARQEAILAGGSSGGVASASLRIAKSLPQDATIALILADRGERYLDTVYSNRWVAQHCPDIEKRKREFE